LREESFINKAPPKHRTESISGNIRSIFKVFSFLPVDIPIVAV